ncbi:MAG: carboxylating nicotinate-nucleotide diphosphorylase [Euryarchaeota archaeon]|nr:carboxylating nicotinate-nucleotide diphosphorylase [Euryarchaeota archaeon]
MASLHTRPLPRVPDGLLLGLLRSDMGRGDLTTRAIVPRGQGARARLVTREGGVAAGLEEAARLFRLRGCRVSRARDGSGIRRGQVLLEISGPARAILEVERTALNLAMRMSGVATGTRRCVEAARRVDSRMRVVATRKTAPGLGLLDKKAVVLGGGLSHRLGLDDGILVKDNHIRLAGSVGEATRRALRGAGGRPVEVEAETLEEAREAARAGARGLLLDNFSPRALGRAVKELRREFPGLALEASGGITPSNVAAYARSGADVLSLGSLTHSARSLDMSLDVLPGIGRRKSL